jgi:glycerate-2-kinase
MHAHLVKNFQSLVGNARCDRDRKARRFALEILESALTACDPRVLVKNGLRRTGSLLQSGSSRINLARFDRIFVVGAGKASRVMTEAVEEILGNEIVNGIVNVPKGTTQTSRIGKVTDREGHTLRSRAPAS